MQEIIKEKNGIRLLRENVEPKYWKKPRYWYWIQYRINSTWKDPEPKVSFTVALDEFNYQSKFEED